MLANFIIAVEAVLPIFLLILLGMGARKMNFMNDAELSHANKAIFQIMFPFTMFYNIYSADFTGVILPGYFAFCMLMLAFIYVLSVAVTLAVEKDNYSRGAMVQAIYRGNFVLMGLPLMQNLMGDEALGLTTFMLAITVPLYNIIAVVTMEIFRGGDLHMMSLLKKILENPLVLGALVGFVFVLTGIKLPAAVEKPVAQLSSSVTPVALLIMGASFRLSSVGENLKDLIIGIIGKLLVGPAIALTAGYLLGYRGIPLALLIIMFGAPCSVSGYPMAQQMGSNGELAAGCLIFSSMFSCITICGWIFIMKQLGGF